jgi:hypothetical protein
MLLYRSAEIIPSPKTGEGMILQGEITKFAQKTFREQHEQ